MQTTSPHFVLNALRALAWMVMRGYRVTLDEPDPRGRTGHDRSPHRIIRITVEHPDRFDAVRWRIDQRYPAPPARSRLDPSGVDHETGAKLASGGE